YVVPISSISPLTPHSLTPAYPTPPTSPLFPYTTLFRSLVRRIRGVTALISRGRCDDARDLPEDPLRAPEASHAHGKEPGSLGPGPHHRGTEDGVGGGHRVGVVTVTGQGIFGVNELHHVSSTQPGAGKFRQHQLNPTAPPARNRGLAASVGAQQDRV